MKDCKAEPSLWFNISKPSFRIVEKIIAGIDSTGKAKILAMGVAKPDKPSNIPAYFKIAAITQITRNIGMACKINVLIFDQDLTNT